MGYPGSGSEIRRAPPPDVGKILAFSKLSVYVVKSEILRAQVLTRSMQTIVHSLHSTGSREMDISCPKGINAKILKQIYMFLS